MNKQRPASLIVAIIVLTALSVVNLGYLVVPPKNPVSSVTVVFIFYSTLLTGAVGLVGGIGLWMLKRWGWWATIAVSAVSLVIWGSFTAHGLLFGDTVPHMVWSVVYTACYAVVLLLVLLPATRQRVTSARTSMAQA